MALVNDIKCARCDRKYSGVRSRCPYCGARRIGRGKYTEDSDNAKGKMLISILILSVFTVAAGVMLFTTPVEDTGPPEDDSSISNPEDGIDSQPGLWEDPTPSPTIEIVETAPPLTVETVQIWVPRSHKAEDLSFWLGRGDTSFQLAAVLDPPGLEIPLSWSSTNEEVFEIETVVGGVQLNFVGAGTATLVLTAGDKEARCIIRVNP